MFKKPIKREIFAAGFIDRVAHHLIYRAIYGDIEKTLIHDSYVSKIKAVCMATTKFIRQATNNYQKQAFILKLGIHGYFMHIKHKGIYQKVLQILDKDNNYNELSFELIDYLLQKTIFNEVRQNYNLKGSKKD